jgi:hypothetical protein
MENLTPQQGFQAMFLFLDAYYQRTKGAAELGDVLGDLSPATDGQPSDPATWEDWLEALRRATTA